MKQQYNGQTPKWALDAIQHAWEKRLANLELGAHNRKDKLTTIPTELLKLTWLESLDLSNNDLISIPDTICQLSKLQTLDVRNNHLTTIPTTIGQLTDLLVLDLSGNRLTYIPDTIAKLQYLQILYLRGNELEIFPEAITQLNNLGALFLDSNKLKDVPETVDRLVNLVTLHLNHNEIREIPRRIIELPKLRMLFLGANPIDSPPPEVLKFSWNDSIDLEKLQIYFRQREEVGEESLYEAKLLIVGEPGAGKTSLARKLIDPHASLPVKDESTEGIDVYTWNFPIPSSIKTARAVVGADFRVNIWDFGGQEIYHATHQFFLSRRSLYVIVADAREQKTDFFHWLDLIEHLGDRSPVLIFNNAFQNRHWAINEQQLQASFPDTFQKPLAFNLAEDSTELDHLRRRIQEQITQLAHVGDVLPRTWVNVRRALENDTRATVSQKEFLQLCKDNGFTRTDDALQLSGYLHDLGVLLHFQDEPSLKHTVILKPEWGTDAVYRVLDNDIIKANSGFFNRADLIQIWHENEYAGLHDELIGLMMKFQLCYAVPNQRNRYIAPQLLSEQPPDYQFKKTNLKDKQKSLHLRYKYEAFMPKGLVTRFIVAMHPHIASDKGKQLVWKTGVLLAKDGALAEVVEDYRHREIRIRAEGKNVQELITIISYQIEELHRPFHHLKFDKLIPCNCTVCNTADSPNFYRLEILKTRLEHGKEIIECDVPPFHMVNIRPLLYDAGAATKPVELPTMLRTLNRDFNDNEFKTLCLELVVNYDNLPGEGLEGKQRELLLLLERNGRIPELINLLRQKRPNFNW